MARQKRPARPENDPKIAGRPRIYTPERLSELAQSLYDWVAVLSMRAEFGILGDWCFANGFNPKYFGRYAEQNEEFKEAYDWAKAYQEHIVAKGALKGTVNPRFAQFFLAYRHDWLPKADEDQKVLANEFGKYLAVAKASTEPSSAV